MIRLTVNRNRTGHTSTAALIRTVINISSYYYAGHRLGQIYHARLRMDCGAPQQHRFLCVVDNPLCSGSVDDTRYCLLVCNRFRILTVELMDAVS